MPFKIPVPESPWVDEFLTLGGQEYKFTFRFNTEDERWRFDLFLNEEPVILGVKVMENQSLLSQYALPDFSHGDIFCVETQNTDAEAGRSNVGIGLPYELVYFSNQELA
jgi:hypothetical protein